MNIFFRGTKQTLTLLWKYTTGSDVFSSPAIGDVDGDGELEIIVGSLDDNVYCLSGNGTLEWKYTTGSDVFSSPAIGDVDGDGELEIIVGSYDNNVYCLEAPHGGVRVYWEGLSGDISDNGYYRSKNIQTVDPDMDFLSTYSEGIIGTNPHDNDSDNDGLPDSWEVIHSLDPLNSSDALQDSDNDGLNNLEEYQFGTNPTDPDSDDDGLSDGWEVEHSVNPLKSDSDGDGFDDSVEVSWGTDPKSPLDNPLTRVLVSIIIIIAAVYSGVLLIRWHRRRKIIKFIDEWSSKDLEP